MRKKGERDQVILREDYVFRMSRNMKQWIMNYKEEGKDDSCGT